jgi:hypothetical protein
LCLDSAYNELEKILESDTGTKPIVKADRVNQTFNVSYAEKWFDWNTNPISSNPNRMIKNEQGTKKNSSLFLDSKRD